MTTETWPVFTAARDERLRRLGRTIAANLARRDTRHPFFRGCIDWHSAVHGTCALLLIARLTGDPAALPDLKEAQPLIDAEVRSVRQGRVPEELPYGFAWALHLDIEASRAGITGFHDLALLARERLLSALDQYSTNPTVLASPYHSNGIWPVIALHRWAAHHDDEPTRKRARQAAERLLAPEVVEPLRRLSGPSIDGFLSPVHVLVQLAGEISADPGSIGSALAAVRGSRPLSPAEMTSPHSAGLNFSRAWACHAAWRMTGDLHYRDAYVDLVVSHVDQPGFWRDDYDSHGHWVPQFGVFALAVASG